MLNLFSGWASDLDINVVKNGEIFDVDVINRSIEMILSTQYGERLFNPSFGCGVQLKLFEGMTKQNIESILDDIIGAIKKWERRVVVLENDARVIANTDENSLVLIIPYVINRNGIAGTFRKKIITT